MDKLNKNEKAYKIMMKRNLKELKKISNDIKRTSIEFIEKGKTGYNAFRWQKELVGEIKLYITYLGYLDSTLLEIGERIDSLNKIEIKNDEVFELKNKYKKLLDKRKQVVKMIKNNTSIYRYLNFADEVISEIPSSTKFYKVYDDMKIMHYTFDIQLEFINAYNNGCFAQKNSVRTSCIDNLFEKSQQEITECRYNNKSSIQRAKLLKVNKI